MIDLLANEIAKGLIETGIEGPFDAVSCSTAGDYPSLGCSQWEGQRANNLLSWIDGGKQFMSRTYSDIANSGELPALKALLDSEQGRTAQREILKADCIEYVKAIQTVPTMDDTRCVIYAGMWCPTSHIVVQAFLRHRWSIWNLRSLETLRNLFRDQYYIAADVGEQYAQGYANRAEITYQYVAGLYIPGIPEYGHAGNGR
ncbi:hypothetical protein [Phascolarctobacterium sp.]|uniref:hypothetical protein n=1 Tax=Phascolarctobacterium sp. TaxID=2049039 RepID=UPI00386E57A3